MRVLTVPAASARIDLGSEAEFELGSLRVRPSERLVVANGETRELQPRMMQVLIALASARPGVVSRDQLMERCWGDVTVGEGALNRCILGLRHLAGELVPAPFTIETVPRVGYRLIAGSHQATRKTPSSWLLGMILLVSLGAAFVVRGHLRSQMMTAVVAAADGSASSRDLAGDLFATLGETRLAQTGQLELVERDADGESLKLKVGETANGDRTKATVLLLDSIPDVLLWSKEFDGAANQTADLRQQLEFTTAQVLECAVRAHADALAEKALKLYLDGCAEVAASSNKPDLITTLRQLVRIAPKFGGGWTELLIAEEDEFVVTGDAGVAAQLRTDIANARKANPGNIEALLAEASLLPSNAYKQRIQLADRAVQLAPDQWAPLVTRSAALFSVGRVNEAVEDARRAAQIEPLSPRVLDFYITTLADSGRTQTALQKLSEAERLWPGASNLEWARFRTNMRYGDPRVALTVMHSENIPAGWSQAEGFLQARLHPTGANKRRAIEDAWRAYRRETSAGAHLIQTLGEFGATDELLSALNAMPLKQATELGQYLFEPVFDEFWRDPRSFTYADRVGLLRYWRSSGRWPDFCFNSGFPYDCQIEARKLGK